MAVTPEMITNVRMEIQDVAVGFYILDDETITYFLEKNNENIRRASMDCARAILFKLSINASDSTVDIFSIRGSKAAEAYRLSLMLYLKDPSLNPVYNLAGIYAGGISVSDMQANVDDTDNNAVIPPNTCLKAQRTSYFDA